MRGVVFTGGREIELMEFSDPTPGPGEVVVEMKASGMCGSDLHQYRRPGRKGQLIVQRYQGEGRHLQISGMPAMRVVAVDEDGLFLTELRPA